MLKTLLLLLLLVYHYKASKQDHPTVAKRASSNWWIYIHAEYIRKTRKHATRSGAHADVQASSSLEKKEIKWRFRESHTPE